MNKLNVIEHLKNYVSEQIDLLMEGGGDEGAPLSPGQVKAHLWREIEQVCSEGAPGRRMTGRVASTNEVQGEPDIALEDALKPWNVLACNRIGARSSDGVSVYYVVLKVHNFALCHEVLQDLRDRGFAVRDWRFVK